MTPTDFRRDHGQDYRRLNGRQVRKRFAVDLWRALPMRRAITSASFALVRMR
jgi:hypothetical protein